MATSPRRGPLLVSATLVCALACGGETVTQAQTDPDEPQLPRDTTPRQGLDVTKLYRLVDLIAVGTHGPVHSLLVMRNGEMVIEEYFRGYDAATLHSLQSVSKSFTSTLLGIAIGRGLIEDVDELVLDFFPQWRDDLALNPLRAQMTLQDVLTMRTGTDYHEVGASAPHWQLNSLPTGWDQFWLNRPMVRVPGTFWQYDSGGVIALSSVLKDRTGDHADVLADDWLFQPLGITERQWFTNQEGHPHMGGGLSLTPRDMLKLGRLYLQGGVWNGEQLVPESWVEASFAQQVTFDLPPTTTRRSRWYGYLWWILQPDPEGAGDDYIYAAIGAGGQYVFVIPEHEMVVAVTSSVQSGNQAAPIGFLYSDVLPAVMR